HQRIQRGDYNAAELTKRGLAAVKARGAKVGGLRDATMRRNAVVKANADERARTLEVSCGLSERPRRRSRTLRVRSTRQESRRQEVGRGTPPAFHGCWNGCVDDC